MYTQGMFNLCKVRCRGVILHNEKMLVVRGSHGRPYYALPGGHLDLGEDPKECIARELLEELGVEARVGRLLVVYSFVNDEGVQSIEFFFEVQNGEDFLAHEEKIKTHAHEIAEVRWITRDEELILKPEEFHLLFKKGELISDQVRFLKG